MLYSVPHEYIKRKVDVRVTDKTIEIFYNHNRIASHRRLYGRKGQYSTVTETQEIASCASTAFFFSFIEYWYFFFCSYKEGTIILYIFFIILIKEKLIV